MIEDKKVVELHGCIVCGRLFNILAVHNPFGRLVDWAITSPGGQKVSSEEQPLVACDQHTSEQIESAIIRWKSRKEDGSSNGQENE
jgi:hypothetical protein